MELTYADPARTAYQEFAPFYDSYTQGYDHEAWLANIDEIAGSYGLRGNRLLDVGCGTGKSFMPMLARGYEVTACDVSPEMVDRALARAAGSDARVEVADLRDLPPLGRFDLVTCIDDPLNYLLTDTDLSRAFEGVARNLRPGGLFAFDLNTISGFRHYFQGPLVMDEDGTFFCWRPESDSVEVEPGGTFNAVIEVFAPDGDGRWQRFVTRHVQRHHPPPLVEELLTAAGFELLSCRGHVAGGRWTEVGDEDVHRKVDYFARRVATSDEFGTRNGGDAA
jgi:SAM-dependent methyltransferase